MTTLLRITPILGAFLSIMISVTCTFVLIICAHIFFHGKRSRETSPFVHQMSLRIGTMHALVVALVFGVLTTELLKLQNTSDSEAISAANIYFTLTDNPSEEAIKLRNLVPVYLNTVIEKDWIELSERPHDLPAWKIIAQMQQTALNWDTKTASEQILRKYVLENLNTIAENRNIRIIERQAPNLPLIFWGIAIVGYILTIMPYLSVELDRRRYMLICCYAIIIGIIFYGIAVLDKPFLSHAVRPSAFEVMYNDIATSSMKSSFEITK